MYQKEVNIVNPTGIHARPASQFVAKAGTYSSKITIRRADVQMTLSVTQNQSSCCLRSV